MEIKEKDVWGREEEKGGEDKLCSTNIKDMRGKHTNPRQYQVYFLQLGRLETSRDHFHLTSFTR